MCEIDFLFTRNRPKKYKHSLIEKAFYFYLISYINCILGQKNPLRLQQSSSLNQIIKYLDSKELRSAYSNFYWIVINPVVS